MYIIGDGHTGQDMRTEKPQHLSFTGCVDLCITCLECFTLALAVNLMYIGKFLCKYILTHIGVMYVESHL
jgi:hypothetical protein